MKNTQWEDAKLGELGEFSNGVNFTRDQMGKSDTHSIKLINVKDLYNDSPYLKFEGLDHITLKSVDKFRGYSVKKHDVFFARSSVKRDGVGVVELAREDNDECVHCGFVIRFRPTSKKVDALYLTYLLRSPFYRQAIINLSSGATITNIAQGNFRKLPIIHPPLPMQQKIAAILSAYDDLIENNNKRIALLEKAAEEIYCEWFVRMRFPGWEQVKFVKGLPDGWKIQPFSEVVELKPTEMVEKKTPMPFASMGDLSTTSMMFSLNETRIDGSGTKFRNNDTLFPRITPSVENGKRGYVMNLEDGQVGLGSTEFIVFREKVVTSEYIYFTTCLPEFRKHAELSMTGASGRQRVQEDCFDYFLVKVPDGKTLKKFTDFVRPFFHEIKAIYTSNFKLKQSRDLLLSRLISGKLSVEALDIRFLPSMSS